MIKFIGFRYSLHSYPEVEFDDKNLIIHFKMLTFLFFKYLLECRIVLGQKMSPFHRNIQFSKRTF